MKFIIFFLRRRTLILKAVLLMTMIWFMATLWTTKSGSRSAIVAPPVAYDDGDAMPLKMAKPATKSQSRTYVNDLPDVPNKKTGHTKKILEEIEASTRVDWLRRLGRKEAAPSSDNALGELGKPVVLPKNITKETKQAVSDGWKKNAFNQYVSDLISIRRKLRDLRDEWCKVPGRYLEDLPQTSVVICFHNEAWSALLRTVYSVLDRSPAHLMKEIILVDDFSDMPHLMQQLDDYMSSLPKVRLVRTTRREGLIRARLFGARFVTTPVLTYLDSHCECTEGWLEPLLDRIARSKTTVVCPVIDVIDDNTLEYHHSDSSVVNVGGFDWSLQFNFFPVPSKERARHQHTAEPVWSPTMAGGLFAIDKDYFESLGTYDSGFDIWGAENLELSFKIWMCGGTLEIVPCSHVGHIFRKRSPYKWGYGVNVLKKNSARLAEVWMDDYAKYYYQRAGNAKGDYGDITGRKELRKKLGCKSFEWYLKNIYPEQFIPGQAFSYGESRDLFIPGVAHGEFWMYSKNGEIRRDETCLDYTGFKDVLLYPCHGFKGNQQWLYNDRTKLLKHGSSKRCMAVSRNMDKIVMETCNESEARQMWSLENFKPARSTPVLT